MTAVLAGPRVSSPPAQHGPTAPAARSRLETGLAGALLLALGGAVLPRFSGGGGLVLQGLGCVAALLWVARERGALSRALGRVDPALLALLALLVLSTGWSADPALTARRVAGVLAASAFGIYLADRYTLTDQLTLVLRSLTVVALLSALLALLAPRYGVAAGGWRGVFLTKNVLARLMALGVLTSLLAMSVEGRRSRRRDAGVCGLVCAVVLIAAGSAFAILVLGLVVAVMVLGLSAGRLQYPFRQATVVGVSALLLAVVAWASLHWDRVLDAFGRQSDLTGRVPLWHSVVPAIQDRFWFGHGYGAFWRGWEQPSSFVWLQNVWGPPHAHNGVLEMALGVGAVGVALWLLVLLRCLLRGLKLARVSRAAYWPVALVLLTLAFNITEVTLMSNALFWALFVAASSSVSARAQRLPAPTSRG